MGTLGMIALLGAFLGMTVGAVSQGLQDKDWNTQAERQKQAAIDEKNRQLNYLDDTFELQKEAAHRAADQKDLQTTVSEALVSGSLGTEMQNLSLNEINMGEDLNAAQMQQGQALGGELSNLAASGTRSSSMADAIDMQAAVNSAQLESQKQTGRQQAEMNLSNILNNVASSEFELQTARDSTTQLRSDYEEGGLEQKNYMLRRTLAENNYDAQLKEIDARISDYNNFGAGMMRSLNSMFHGISTGASTAYNIGEFGGNQGWWNLG